MIHTLKNGIILSKSDAGTCLIMNDELRKSFSSDLAKNAPGGRWITVTDPSSPLHGRHLYILEHKDKSATILVGGGEGLRHKVLHTRQKGSAAPEDAAAEAKEGEQKPSEEAAKPEEPQPEEPPKKKELTGEQRQEAEESIKILSGDIQGRKDEMFNFVKQQWGIDRELTPEEQKKVEKKTESIENPVDRAVAQAQEIKKVRDAKNETIQEIIKAAKHVLIDEDPTAQGGKGIAAIVKEHAETLVGMHLAIKDIEKERKDLRKMVRVGKLNDRFRSGKEILADYQPLTSQEIKEAVGDEHALKAELDAHYKLVKVTKGIEGVDRGVPEKGEEAIAKHMRQGGFEAYTGFMGLVAKKAILSKKMYDALGASNAAILSKHYLQTAGHDVKEAAAHLEQYFADESGHVARRANEQGDHFMENAKQVRTFGKGLDNIMSVQQALGSSLKYQGKAYEAYGQAEGALNQGAELLYAYKNKANEGMEFTANSTDSLERKRQALGLKASDVIMKKGEDGGHQMVIPPRSFERMIKEDETFAHGRGLGLEHTPAEVAAGKANTDEFFPTDLNSYTPTEKDGSSEKVVVRPHEQSACHLLAQQKKIYLNFPAGTGKSKTVLMMKAHLDDLHGKSHKMIVSMPDKLTANFADEVRKWTRYEPIIITGAMAPKKRKELLAAATGNQVIICNHDTMRIDKAAVQAAKFDFVVCDEAHKSTQRDSSGKSIKSEGLKEIASEAPYYVAMSGTPTPSDLSQLFFHLNIADPEKYNLPKEFMAQFGSIHKGEGYKKAVAAFMANQLSDRVMTLTKNVDAEFHHKTHRVELSPLQKKMYREISDEFTGNKKFKGAVLNRDRQLTYLLNGGAGNGEAYAGKEEAFSYENNSKYAKLHDIIEDHLKTKGPTEKIGIYAANNATIAEVQKFLAKHYPQFGHVVFNGGTPKNQLDALKNKITSDPNTMFSLHMKAGVEGLNLQHTDSQQGLTTIAALSSGEDSFSTLDQMFSRGWRTGANRPVHGHTILTDSPHDLATSLRLHEKRAVGDLVSGGIKSKAKIATP